MLGYSDTSFSSALCPPGSPPKVPSPLIDQHREKRGTVIQLTPLWEHVVRNQTIPKDINLDDVFIALNDRLRDPEWEVRQHALRVLVAVIPVMDDTLDQRMEILLGDLVGNLGHPGPAVRKGALDSLKVYLTHSAHADDILRNIVYRGVEHYTDNQLQSDVVVGIILSLPSLIFPGRSSEHIIEYIIKTLITKLVQVTFQEVSLRSLARIRDVISPKEFDRILEDTQPNTRHDFELLCQVYEAHSQKNMFSNHELSSDEDRPKWNDQNANIIHDNRWNSDSDSAGIFSPDEFSKPVDGQDTKDNENNVPSGKLILETEIQFNSSTAVTMKILEEREKSLNDSDSDEDNRDCVVQVLSDSDNDDFELRRRTPRRVRFGGEIVKLRTPDSDSNHPSDTDNDITITTTSNEDADNPVIEIKFITNGKDRRNHQSRSLIPVPVIPVTQKPKARSLPTSPNRKLDNQAKSRLLFQSHPNLTRAHFFPKQKSQKLRPPKRLTVEIPKKTTNYIDNATSPINHREVELLHNLSRSPVLVPESPIPVTSKREITKEVEQPIKNERKISTADSVLLDSKQKMKEERTIVTADLKKPRDVDVRKMVLHKDSSIASNAETSFTTDMSDNDSNPSRTFSSFILKDSGSDGIQSDCYIPNLDTGDCLTCSSSGSEGVQTETNWETSGLIDKAIIDDMHDKDEWRVRLRGFESFKDALQSPDIQKGIVPHLGAIFHFLFNAERQPKLQSTIEIILKNLISNSAPENLKSNLSQLAVSLSKMGAPSGVRLAIALMQKVSAKTFLQYVLEDSIMSSRSAKTREGALQIILCATTMFPSTDFDSNLIANKVALAATDRKRRIRQATLDVLAVLGQIGRPADVLEAVELASKDLPGKDGLIAAVRARLSRRQHPIVEADGSVIYASPAVGHGADVEWVAAGSGSISPVSARSRRRVLDTISRVESSTERVESAVLPQRNMWSARRYQDPAESFGENLTWALVPVNNNNNNTIKEESQSKTYPGTQLWAIEQANSNGDIRLNGSSGSLRPVYLLQAQQPPPNNHIRLRQVVQNDSSSRRTSAEKSNHVYSRGRSSSPPVRLVQIKGATKATRGQSSSPPEFARTMPEVNIRRRIFPPSVSSGSGSSQSRGSPPRNNWQREFQSAIPVPVSGEGRSRFRTRHRDPLPSQQQPMTAFGHQGPSVGSAPVHVYGRTKSPSPTRFSVDKFSISQDSGINQQTSSGSESSDYYTPPAEPYLPIQATEPAVSTNQNNPRDDSFDQTDRSDTPPIPQQPSQRERFINLEDSPSGSDFEEADTKKESDESQDEYARNQKFQKLQEEHVVTSVITKEPYREMVTEQRLSKSHHDLSELKNFNRKTINSAPAVKHLKGFDNNIMIENQLNNNAMDEESKSSQSTMELKSVNQSLSSFNQSQNSLSSQIESNSNQSRLELRSPNYQSQMDLRSLNQSNGDLHSLNRSHGDLNSLNQSNGDLSLHNQSQGDLRSLNQSQGDLRSLNQSLGDLRSLNQSQGDLQSVNSHTELNLEPRTEIVKYPDIVRKTPKQKPELKRRISNVPKKVPEVFPDSLRNFPKPREGFNEMISQLESPEWEMSVKGLQALVRLIRHHQDTVEAQMHTVCVLLGRHIKNLRSQVARAACLAATEMFGTHKKVLEPELEELTCPLLHRTADTNKFLRGDANAALDAMCLNMSTPRVVSVLSTRGATHHNAVVRCSTARLITDLVKRLGPQKVFQLPKDTRDRILVIGANMLMEGSLETRKHAKNMLTELSSHGQFQRAVYEAVPSTTMRHISKTINNFK